MTINLEVLDLYPTEHPVPSVGRLGFPLDHPYLEQCWAPVVGPSSVALLRHCVARWQDAVPARAAGAELSAEIGLGGTRLTANGPLWRTMNRLERFGFLQLHHDGTELRVYTHVPPVSGRQLDRLPPWSRSRHEVLLGRHLDTLAGTAPAKEPPAHLRMAAHLDRLTTTAAVTTRTLGR